MLAYIPSPFMMHWCGILLYLIKRFPSISSSCGFFFKLSSERCMALNDARRILIVSISLLSILATANASASASIIVRSSFLFFSFTCFESLSKGWKKFFGKITAAANTGPARQPRPASSRPASISSFWKKGLSRKLFYIKLKFKSHCKTKKCSFRLHNFI